MSSTESPPMRVFLFPALIRFFTYMLDVMIIGS